MRDLVTLFVHLIAAFARLLGPGGMRSVVAEWVLVKLGGAERRLGAFLVAK